MCTRFCTMSTLSRLSLRPDGVMVQKECTKHRALENCPLLCHPGGRHCASKEQRPCPPDKVTQCLHAGDRDAPVSKDAVLCVSNPLESWRPGSTVISYDASVQSPPLLLPTPPLALTHSCSPSPCPSEAATFTVLFTEVGAEAQ